MKEWAFQIRIPTLPWKKLFTRQTLLLAALLALLPGSYFYWTQQVRPFLRLDHAVLCASTTHLYATEAGRILGKAWEEGDSFRKDEILFSLTQDKITSMQKEFALRIHACDETRDREKSNLEKTMQRYVQLQAEGASAEVMDKLLVEVQEAQQKIIQAEEDSSVLAAEKLSLEKGQNPQAVAAPFDGMILRCSKHLGEVVGSGEQVLSLLNPQVLWLESEIPEGQLAVVQTGTSAVVTFQSFPGREWPARVSWISPVVERGRIKIRLSGEGLPVKPGLSAQVRLRVR
jgi:multidrug efflux system membrane fusion protein